MRNINLIEANASKLTGLGYQVQISSDYDWVVVYGQDLPGESGKWTDAQGRVVDKTSVLIDIPLDFPMSPPGVGFNHPTRAIHLPLLYYKGRMMADFYKCNHTPWYWLCFQKLDWNPATDNLLTLIGLVEVSISERLKRANLW